MNSELEDKIKEINTEDFIWLIYIGIIFLSWYSNSQERKYFVFKDNVAKDKYRFIIKIIFFILIFVYLYFLKDSIDGLKKLKPSDSEKKKRLVYLSFVSSLLIAISGFIFLYLAFADENLDV